MLKKRVTKQKELIQKELDSINSFFSSDDLFVRVKKINSSIGIATIYRFLNELKKDNQIFLYKCNRKTIYSKCKKSHCHFVCEKTGKVIHFSVDSLDFLKDKIPGSISSFQIEVRGLCNKHSSFLYKNKN